MWPFRRKARNVVEAAFPGVTWDYLLGIWTGRLEVMASRLPEELAARLAEAGVGDIEAAAAVLADRDWRKLEGRAAEALGRQA